MSQESLGKARYYVLLKDNFSGYPFIDCLTRKSHVLDHFKSLCKLVPRETGNCIEKLRRDRGGEFLGRDFIKFLADSYIRHELTTPYTPEQNGSAERENCTLIKCVRTMLHTKQLSLSL